jgi:hypothetical protein
VWIGEGGEQRVAEVVLHLWPAEPWPQIGQELHELEATSCASSSPWRSRKLKPRGWSRSARRRTWTVGPSSGSRPRMSLVRSP